MPFTLLLIQSLRRSLPMSAPIVGNREAQTTPPCRYIPILLTLGKMRRSRRQQGLEMCDRLYLRAQSQKSY